MARGKVRSQRWRFATAMIAVVALVAGMGCAASGQFALAVVRAAAYGFSNAAQEVQAEQQARAEWQARARAEQPRYRPRTEVTTCQPWLGDQVRCESRESPFP